MCMFVELLFSRLMAVIALVSFVIRFCDNWCSAVLSAVLC